MQFSDGLLSDWLAVKILWKIEHLSWRVVVVYSAFTGGELGWNPVEGNVLVCTLHQVFDGFGGIINPIK